MIRWVIVWWQIKMGSSQFKRWGRRTEDWGRRMLLWGRRLRNWKLYWLSTKTVAILGEKSLRLSLFCSNFICAFLRNEDKSHGATTSFMLNSLKSPPQTVPEDLRVQRLGLFSHFVSNYINLLKDSWSVRGLLWCRRSWPWRKRAGSTSYPASYSEPFKCLLCYTCSGA